MTDADLVAIGSAALANDFDPVPWDEAPAWRRTVSIRVAESALASCGLSSAEHARAAWTLTMTTLGWQWGRDFDEASKRHPGVVFGDLTPGGVRHWNKVVEAVRVVARERGLRITGE